ncbi:MAG TPA: tetratricopeptide repeat protein [Polyangia bacterium]|nr:tetratricopeptide repeat protein [Polyangia bacterium]
MSLRARIRVIWIAITGAMTFGSYAVARAAGWDPVKVALILAIPLLLGLVAVQIVLVRRARQRMERAFLSEDIPGLRREVASLIDFFRDQPRVREALRLSEAVILALEEKFAEARAILESLDQSALGEAQLPTVMNNLAWCMAHLGEADRAIELARTALARAEGRPPGHIAYLLGTLGVAQVLAGQPAEAVEVLQKALGKGAGQPRPQAIRAYYLGEALRALGRSAEAQAAYERAVAEAPHSTYARRARERLQAADHKAGASTTTL